MAFGVFYLSTSGSGVCVLSCSGGVRRPAAGSACPGDCAVLLVDDEVWGLVFVVLVVCFSVVDAVLVEFVIALCCCVGFLCCGVWVVDCYGCLCGGLLGGYFVFLDAIHALHCWL